MTNLAPVCVFVYNRPAHTEKMLKSLKANQLFEKSEVIVFADGIKEGANEEDLKKVNEVRNLLTHFAKNKNVTLHFSEINRGLSVSILTGIDQVLNNYGKIIVLEDDLELSPGFLQFMNEALLEYESSEKVMHVGGYMVPNSLSLQSPLFMRAPTIWGWGTWKNKWRSAELNPTKIIERIKDKKNENFEYEFNVRDGYPYFKLLNDIEAGKVNAWSVLWYANIFLREGLCLMPSKSLVRNTGFDGSGENCDFTDLFLNADLLNEAELKNSLIEESEICISLFQAFWKLQSIKVRKDDHSNPTTFQRAMKILTRN